MVAGPGVPIFRVFTVYYIRKTGYIYQWYSDLNNMIFFLI